MGWLERLFGKKEYKDERGVYFGIECGRCQKQLKVRADRQYDLNRQDSGFAWNKTIVCDKCFQKMPAHVHFDGKYNIIEQMIERGKFIDAQV